MNTKNEKTSIWQNEGIQTIIASLVCVFIGLLMGFIVLLCINPSGAGRAMSAILRNFLYFPNPKIALEYFGSTLARTAPLLLCTLSVIFAYKVGLFNIGCSGQYTVGAGLALYLGIGFHLPWYVCVIAAIIGGGLMGAIAGILKAYLNVNEVIAGIMLNWIALYSINMLLDKMKASGSPFTMSLKNNADQAILPHLGLDKLFSDNRFVTIAIPLAIIITFALWILMEKTKLGFELRATGFNKNAAQYAGMKEKRNMILTMVISGSLAGLGAAFLFLTDIEQWSCAQTFVPTMGFSGVAAAFLGGLHPIGAIFSAFFIQHITSGGAYIDKMTYASQISDLISSLIIYFCSFVLFFKTVIKKRQAMKIGGTK